MAVVLQINDNLFPESVQPAYFGWLGIVANLRQSSNFPPFDINFMFNFSPTPVPQKIAPMRQSLNRLSHSTKKKSHIKISHNSRTRILSGTLVFLARPGAYLVIGRYNTNTTHVSNAAPPPDPAAAAGCFDEWTRKSCFCTPKPNRMLLLLLPPTYPTTYLYILPVSERVGVGIVPAIIRFSHLFVVCLERNWIPPPGAEGVLRPSTDRHVSN